ncbi:hypothetical protein L1987_06478 [Smallanthus sonchifolius]|uniref:Uncharacterized protein n=1 Tax=Smallanthus sonchifolius TaxID=185202 RepID=A0ACB9JYG9_9ASTR|nr:hypothetical protein L1987_06478 [Smallanthus sonchifolius]
MKDFAAIKMSTLCEMVKQVRKEQIAIQQSISLNASKAPTSKPLEIIKVKKEVGEESKDSPPQLTPPTTEKLTSLGVDRFNENESAKRLMKALKFKGYTGYEANKNGVKEYISTDRIVTLVPDDLKALLRIPLKNEANDEVGDFLIKTMERKLEVQSSFESLEGDGDEEEEDKWSFRNDHRSSDNDEEPADTEVPLAQSKEYVDGNFELKREIGSVENYSSIDFLCTDERSMLNLVDLPMGNEEKNEKAYSIEHPIKELLSCEF